MLLNLTYYSSEPIQNQIVNQVLLRIFEEDKLPGDQLASIGKISRQHHIDRASIRKAFSKLEQLGVIHAKDKDKYFVNDISTRALKNLIDRNYFTTTQNFSEYDLFKTELSAAKQIQNALLPKNLPYNDYIDVSAYSTISEDVGGDFYDFYEIGPNKYGILIGDASGKGFPAAMLISQIQAIIKSDQSLNRTIGQTVHLINSYMNTYSSAKYFATLFYGVLDIDNGLLSYINAGHNFPILLNKNGEIIRLSTTGPAMGLMNNAHFEETSIKISDEDLLFMFTDGLSERMNINNVPFGEERIIGIITHLQNSKTEKIVEEVNRSISKFSNGSMEIDDTTFLVVKTKKVKR